MVREKQIQHGRNNMITEKDALNEFLNVDFPKAQREAAEEMRQAAGYFEIARDIMQRRWFVDTFALEIVDEEEEEDDVEKRRRKA
jgi:bacterioferritin (cytochrome b1)